MKKKICLVTCFLDNFGACLQAYSLQKTIKTLGYNCEILKYLVPEGYRKNKLSFVYNSRLYTFFRCLISKNYKNNYQLNKCRERNFNLFRKRYLVFSQKIINDSQLAETCTDYIAYVCGSDQIWNPTFYNCCNKVYYLTFVPNDIKKIAYAPSIGVSSIPQKYQKQFVEYVNRLDNISVREETGVKIIKEIVGKDAALVLDPTLLLSKEEWSYFAGKSRLSISKPYIFCYFFGNNNYLRAIEYFKKKLNVDVYIIPFNAEQNVYPYKKIREIGPVEFVYLIKNAKLVLTDSFHATAFSLNFNVPFYAFRRNKKTDVQSMNSRIEDILTKINLLNRLLEVSDNYDVDDVPLDFTDPNLVLEEMRKVSNDYLKNALNGIDKKDGYEKDC